MSQQIDCEEGFLQTKSGKIYYIVYKGQNSNGIPIIMIHGGPGFTHHYLEPLYGLASERPVIFYDQLGCGKSDRPENLSYCTVPYFIEELSTLVKHFGYERVSLLGHSWGSAIAAEYAISNKNVSHLILASPYMSSPLWNEDIKLYKNALPLHMQTAIEVNDYSSEKFIEAYNEYYKRHVYGNAKNDRSMVLAAETASAEVYNTMWGPDEFNITGVLKDYDCTDRISNISAKTLFTAGEFDTGSPRSCKIMSAKINNSAVKTFKACAHFPHLELGLEYKAVLRDFLNDKKPASNNRFFNLLKNIFRLIPSAK